MLLITHRSCLLHEMQQRHPERPDRLRAVLDLLESTGLARDLGYREASPASMQALQSVHDPDYLRTLSETVPESGLIPVDPDTAMGPSSLRAAALAAGAVADGVHAVLDGDDKAVFCAVRPPGHHAEHDAAMGFCFYNSIALGAVTALDDTGVERVAILDFDVHHGNGTVDIFRDRPEVLVCSSFQHPFYPHRYADLARPNIVNTPLPAGTGSAEFRASIEAQWLPAIDEHRPQLILVSAGFDAHRLDPLAQLELTEDDFRWITRLIVDRAKTHAAGRVVSALEGGYDLRALAASAHAHIEELLAG
ncbi:MAG: histone deacetylase family protein [Pseudomonadales bacterium]|nr:histone deacetylase family protein [Pseudomonadales bacterium]NIX08393.1 histone deacetylase family protein [Pseudomonadales bacterium]